MDILQYAIANGIIDLRGVAEECALRKREEVLSKHHIWKGKNGYYYSKVNGKLIKKKQLSDLNQALIDLHEEKTPTVADLYKVFLDRRRHLSRASKYRYDKIFRCYFKDIADKKVISITEFDIEEMIISLLAEGITSKEFTNFKVVIRGIFKLAKKQELVNFRINETLEDMNITNNEFKKPQHKKQVLNTDEYNRIIEYLKKHQDMRNLGILLLLKSGLRVGELAALKPQDIGKDFINVCKTESSTSIEYDIVERTKTDAGTRKVLIAEQDQWILRELKSRRAFNDYVFDFKSYAFRYRLYTICEKLGIERVSPHKLRKTYASRLYGLGLDERFIITQMGHTNIRCTKDYYIKDTLTLDEKRQMLKLVT